MAPGSQKGFYAQQRRTHMNGRGRVRSVKYGIVWAVGDTWTVRFPEQITVAATMTQQKLNADSSSLRIIIIFFYLFFLQ